jgi:hypothetical protein
MTKDQCDRLASAIHANFTSPNVPDQNFEPANVVDAVNYISLSLNRVAKAITPADAASGHDAMGGHVESLTEAVMGITGGLLEIARAIESHGSSIELLAGSLRAANTGGSAI